MEKKLENEKCEHDLELKQLREEVRSGNQIRESLEQKIKRGEEHLEERKEELLEKSEQLWKSERRGNELALQLEISKEYGKTTDEMREEDCKRSAEIREVLWEEADRKQEEHELEIDQLKERARLEYAEMSKK